MGKLIEESKDVKNSSEGTEDQWWWCLRVKTTSSVYLFIRQVGLQARFCQHSAGGEVRGTQAEVIVVLSGELLHSRGKKRVHLLGQNLEAKTENHPFPHKSSASCRDSYRYKKVGARA